MRLFITLLLVTVYSFAGAQVQSDCTIPELLRSTYDRDVKGLAMKRMQAQNSPDNLLIEIPTSVQDSIYEGMAAILNTMSEIPEADSVFNLYCVHDNAISPAVFGMIIGVDTDSPIATAWDNGNTFTGNAILDTLLADHGFVLQSYLSFGAGVLYSNEIWNIAAIADSLSGSVPGIEYVEPDFLIGGAGRIEYSTDEAGNRFYAFRYEWNDCFDGCDNFYTWNFTVAPDCSVTFTGIEEGGVFGLEGLPEPANCNLFTDTDEVLTETPILLFPNPGHDQFFYRNAPETATWILYNSLGQQVLSGGTQQRVINTSQLTAGIYWFKMLNENDQVISQQAWIKQ